MASAPSTPHVSRFTVGRTRSMPSPIRTPSRSMPSPHSPRRHVDSDSEEGVSISEGVQPCSFFQHNLSSTFWLNSPGVHGELGDMAEDSSHPTADVPDSVLLISGSGASSHRQNSSSREWKRTEFNALEKCAQEALRRAQHLSEERAFKARQVGLEVTVNKYK